MMRIDEKIIETSEAICREIALAKNDEEAKASAREIIKNLRDLVEAVAFKEYCANRNIDILPSKEEGEAKYSNGIKYASNNPDLKYLKEFHNRLQVAMSHMCVNKNISRTLLESYFCNLLKIRNMEKDKYNLEILDNLYDFPFEKDKKLTEYYFKILEKLKDDTTKKELLSVRKSGRCYITRKKLIVVNKEVMYELTLSPVNENTSKFDRTTVYSLEDIPDYYAAVFDLMPRSVKFDNKYYDVFVVTNYGVSIRPCEIDNICKIINKYSKQTNINHTEYKNLMNILTKRKCSLLDIIDENDDSFIATIEYIKGEAQNNQLSECLQYCRKFINSNLKGSNILKYLLFIMTKSIVAKQYCNEKSRYLNGLCLKNGTIPFEEMPFSAGLLKHNPSIYDLVECFDIDGREHELLGRYIRNNTENNNILYTKISNLDEYNEEKIRELILIHNNSITYPGHKPHRHIEEFCNHIYINEYDADAAFVLKSLQSKAQNGDEGYKDFADDWVNNNPYAKQIDDDTKKDSLLKLYDKSKVAVIYGSAGTGKTTFIKYVSEMFKTSRILYLANTNPAVSNLRRIIDNSNNIFQTIEKAKYEYYGNGFDILVIDECSTVSNSDIKEILSKINFNLLLLAGDTYQIESIRFGNWFSLAKSFLPKYSIFELSETKRTKDQSLLEFWNIVRNEPEKTLECISTYGLYNELDDSILNKRYEDEIVLCLNYDGLYGINNLNRMMQKNNPNKGFYWRLNTYKVGDPVLFNETTKYNGLIYNNLKGKIVEINKQKDSIVFHIEIDKTITESMARSAGLKYIGQSENKKSILEFNIKSGQISEDGDDDDSFDTIIPFQVAYAVSIHKSQGLEYDSVKIVITSDNEDAISHNIFYTAVTRAKKELKIYSLEKTLGNVIANFVKMEDNEDKYLLSNKHNINILNKK